MATPRELNISQLNASDVLHDFSCNPCAKDGHNTEAFFQCSDCHAFYCQRCVTGHNKFTENHNVVDKSSKLFGQGQGQPPLSARELPTDLCEEHHGEVIKMFCRKHETVCCTSCVAVKHRSCDGVEYIPNIAKGFLKRLDKNQTISSMEEVKYELQDLKSKVQNELKDLSKKRDGILDDIHRFKKCLAKRVRELEKKSTKDVQDHYNKIADELNGESKKIDDILKGIEKRLDNIKQFKSSHESQKFVDIKYGEMKVSDGKICVQNTLARKTEQLTFELNKDIENYMFATHSLGILRGPVEKSAVADRSERNVTSAVKLPCPSCGDHFEPEIMQEHMRIHSADFEKEFVCPKCGEGFDTDLDQALHYLDC